MTRVICVWVYLSRVSEDSMTRVICVCVYLSRVSEDSMTRMCGYIYPECLRTV